MMMHGDSQEKLRLGNGIQEIGKPWPKAKDFTTWLLYQCCSGHNPQYLAPQAFGRKRVSEAWTGDCCCHLLELVPTQHSAFLLRGSQVFKRLKKSSAQWLALDGLNIQAAFMLGKEIFSRAICKLGLGSPASEARKVHCYILQCGMLSKRWSASYLNFPLHYTCDDSV